MCYADGTLLTERDSCFFLFLSYIAEMLIDPVNIQSSICQKIAL